MASKNATLIVALALLLAQPIAAQLPNASPLNVGISAEHLARMDNIIQASIEKKELPGAVVLVARHGRIVWRKAYGARAVEPQREARTTNTIFDLASLTKIVATATSIMILVERGEV
ncbi:MAG TPA: serine hydrolase, partial [Pyrinomonadaceae bacterium]|nr:serine hydrolase [Pyrinomonadaceae bacterium]